MPNEIFLERADQTANEIIKRLSPYCKPNRCMVVGSIRRRRPRVHDIDIVLIPSDPWNLHSEILNLACPSPPQASGKKIIRLKVNSIQVDIYFADDSTWWTLVLIRTGSTEHNIKLCSIAKKRNWHLAASGEGLFNEAGQRVAGDSEEGIFSILGLDYVPPEKRG